MEAQAILRYVRITPRKARVVANAVRGKAVHEADNILRFTPKRAAGIIRKVLHSAVSNAVDRSKGGKLDEDKLFVRRILVDPGPILKRWRPGGRGSAQRRQKKQSHITIVVAEKE